VAPTFTSCAGKNILVTPGVLPEPPNAPMKKSLDAVRGSPVSSRKSCEK